MTDHPSAYLVMVGTVPVRVTNEEGAMAVVKCFRPTEAEWRNLKKLFSGELDCARIVGTLRPDGYMNQDRVIWRVEVVL